MSVTIRLSRLGRKKRPFYRLVAADKAARRDGRFLEILGTFNPLLPPDAPAEAGKAVNVKEDRFKYWISVGAQCSDTVSQLIEKEYPGYLTGIVNTRLDKLKAVRKARKARSTTTTAKTSDKKAKKATKKEKVAKAA